jgi:excinuclease UvrABC nuclease subunit
MNQTGISNMGPGPHHQQMEGPQNNQQIPRALTGNPASAGFYDADTQNRMRQLEMDKALAVQNEHYDQAKLIRDQIERLKSVGTQLSSLDA